LERGEIVNKKKVWTNAAYEMLFEELMRLKHNGTPIGRYGDGWTDRPPGVTTKEWYEIGETLRRTLIAKGAFSHAQPKSGLAVCQQIAHATYPSSHPSFASMRARLRMIAYYTGFMDMADIVAIETEAKRRRAAKLVDEITIMEDNTLS
jgi:hypothetical protein